MRKRGLVWSLHQVVCYSRNLAADRYDLEHSVSFFVVVVYDFFLISLEMRNLDYHVLSDS